MNRFIHRVMAGFAAVFLASVAAITVYAVFWQAPEHRCEQHGNWWDPEDRVCAKPIFLPNVTHRPLGSPPLGAGGTRAAPPS
jgi:hypothetical protein